MPDYIDLHIHTDHSDGIQSPADVVDRAIELGLKAVSITDHDAVTGAAEAQSYARGKSVEVIVGIELSAAKTDDDIHILGYFVRPDSERLLETIEKFRRIRFERGKKMVMRLAEVGIKLDFDKVLALAGEAAVGRPHVAEALFKGGFVPSYNDAFRKYLYLNGPVYVPKAKITPGEAIELIHSAGGLAVMAHPGLTDRDDMIAELVAWGLDGLEIYHPTHNHGVREKYKMIADKYRLVYTGGSDSHNRKGRYGDIGDEKVPFKYLDAIKTAWRLKSAGNG